MERVSGNAAIIDTARLRLTPFARADLDRLAALYGDPKVMRARKLGVQSRVQSAAWLAGYVDHWRARGFGMWCVCERASGDFVGECGLRPLRADAGEIELSYGLLPAYWGRGLAGEAARAACDFAFGRTSLDEIVAITRAANARSRRVLDRLGFRLLEIAKPGKHAIARYGLTRARYREHRRQSITGPIKRESQ